MFFQVCVIHLYLKNVYLKKVRTFPVIFYFQKDTNRKVCSNIWFILHCFVVVFFFSLYPSLIFSATAINEILTYPEVSVKKQVSWKSSGCTEIITLFTSVALCLLTETENWK